MTLNLINSKCYIKGYIIAKNMHELLEQIKKYSITEDMVDTLRLDRDECDKLIKQKPWLMHGDYLASKPFQGCVISQFTTRAYFRDNFERFNFLI